MRTLMILEKKSYKELERRRKISETMKGKKPKNFDYFISKAGSFDPATHPTTFKKGHKYVGDRFKAAQEYNKKHGIWMKGKHHSEESKEKLSKIKTIHGKNTYAKKAYKEYGFVCNRCKITDKRVLLVHHKDRNRYNNEIENLEVMCWNCHIIEHNRFRGKRNGS